VVAVLRGGHRNEIMNTIDKILIGCAIAVIAFTVTMIVIFCIFQDVPDTLIDNFYNLFTGEAVITFLIWWIKKKGQKNDKDNSQSRR
jgi:Fe2+ transport system protein B